MRRNLWLAILFVVILCPGSGSAQTAPVIAPSGILNAASLAFGPANVAAPGSLITIFGTGLSASTGTSIAATLPYNINGTVVEIGATYAPLLYVSATQINAQVPFGVPAGAAPVVVYVNGNASTPVQLKIQATSPGIFTASQNGQGTAQATHGSNSAPVSESAATAPGEEIQIVVTGLGATISSGSAPPEATGQHGVGQPVLNVPSVTIGGADAVVNFAEALGPAGEYVVDLIVPSASTTGDQPLVLTSGGNQSQPSVTIPVSAPPPPPPPPPTGSTGGIGGTTSSTPGGPAIFAGGILNAASLDTATKDTAAPGELISIYGTNLATTTTGASGLPLPTQLSGTSVTIGGVPAPVLLVSPSQVNVQVPFEIQVNSTVDVVVTVNGATSAAEGLKIVATDPGIFTVTANGSGPAEVFHADGTLVTNASPAVPGEQVTLFATGLGTTQSSATLPAVTDGQAGKGQVTVITPTITVGGPSSSSSSSSSSGTSSGTGSSSGTLAQVIAAIAAQGAVGQYAIQFVVPNVPAGDQNITVAAEGSTSTAATVRVGFLFPQPPNFLALNLAGNFTADFSVTVTVPGPPPVGSDTGSAPPPQLQETAQFEHTIANQGCTIQISGSGGPTYTGLLHCQDYTDPNNLIAIIVGLANGQFAGDKLVFTSILNTGISQFFYDGCAYSVGGTATTPCTTGPPPIYQLIFGSNSFALSASGAITAADVSLDFGPSGFAVGGQVVGTINVAVALGAFAGSPGQTIAVGGGIVETIQSLQP